MILFDSHVHLYKVEYLPHLLWHARSNFENIARKMGLEKPDCAICLTQTSRSPSFQKVMESCGNLVSNPESSNRWSMETTNESNTIELKSASEKEEPFSIFLIGGQQIVCSERLELLSIGNETMVPDGLSLDETLSKINASGGIPVIPWGVGKWLGKRGKILKQIILKNRKYPFFLGDNSARLIFWQFDRIMSMARKFNIQTINGSDPNMFPSSLVISGSYGVLFWDVFINPNEPAKTVRTLLIDDRTKKSNYGKPQTVGFFLLNQIKLNLNRIKQKKTAQ